MIRSLALLAALTVACGHTTPATVSKAHSAPVLLAMGAQPAQDDDNLPTLDGKFTDGAKTFAEVKEQLLQRYVTTDVTEDDLYRAAVQGMLQYADPKRQKWNRLLSPADLAEMQADLQGQVTGVGIRIGQFDPATGYTTVVGSLPGSPAERAGIMPSDIIVTVDGRLFKGKSLRDIVHAVRGKAGEPVTLSILRGDKLLSIPITRETIAYDNVEQRMFSGGVGYVLIRSFASKTPEQLERALRELDSHGARGLIVDLRDNQGGAFEQAVSSAELLTSQGARLVSVEKRGGKEEVYTSKSDKPRILGGVPVLVLVNHDTSSGAELLTAALRDSRHAQVLGTHTYGKWTVQTLEDLQNGFGIKYTVGVFKSPAGKTFEGVGLTPDVEVDMDSDLMQKGLRETDPEQQLTIDQQLRTAVNLLGLRVQ